MEKISIRAALKAGWQSFAVRPWYLLGLAIAFIVMTGISLGNALVSALSYIVYGGFLMVLLNHFRGEKIEFDDIFNIDNRWISFAFLGIIKTVLILLGFLCFIVPGIYLTVRWMFAEILVLDQGMRPLEALRASSQMTIGVRWKLFFFVVVAALLIVLGIIALVIGAVLASIVLTLAVFSLYETLLPKVLNETVTVGIVEMEQ